MNVVKKKHYSYTKNDIATCSSHLIFIFALNQNFFRSLTVNDTAKSQHSQFRQTTCGWDAFRRGSGQKVSISPTFYEQLFRMKVFWAAFLYLHCRFKLFWRLEIGAKAACKMLAKLTQGCWIHQHIYLQLLRTQIPKAQKRQSTQAICLPFWSLRA